MKTRPAGTYYRNRKPESIGHSLDSGQGIKLEKKMAVRRPPEEVFAFWRRFENLPRFMAHLESVTCTNKEISHWIVNTKLATLEWDARIIEEKPGQMISWQSLKGSDVDSAGSVWFIPTNRGLGTVVKVSMKYSPPGGKLGAAIAKLFGQGAEKQITEDLTRLKNILETGRTDIDNSKEKLMKGLRHTFVEELKDLYDAEKQITRALPKMARAAEHEDLRMAFEEHLGETEAQIDRLERVFELFDEPVKAKRCKAMQGLIEEGEDLIKEKKGDAALIAAAQKVEHYEIASYGSLVSWANLLEEEEAAGLLEDTLSEEKEADEKLTDIAECTINPEEAAKEEPREKKTRQSTIRVRRIK